MKDCLSCLIYYIYFKNWWNGRTPIENARYGPEKTVSNHLKWLKACHFTLLISEMGSALNSRSSCPGLSLVGVHHSDGYIKHGGRIPERQGASGLISPSLCQRPRYLSVYEIKPFKGRFLVLHVFVQCT